MQLRFDQPAVSGRFLLQFRSNRAALTRPSRAPFARMAEIYAVLSAGQVRNARQFAEDFQCSTRTILRDLEFMKVQLLLPIEYDARRWGFRLVC